MDNIAIKEQEFTSAASAAIATAHNLTITSEEDLRVAANLMDGFKKAKKSVEDFFKPMKDKAHQAHKEICARETDLLTPYKEADTAVKGKVTAYNAEQRRLADIEAARIRAAQGKESRRLMDEAEKAETNGNVAEAESLLKQAVITETIKTPVRQAKVAGISYRVAYNIEITDEAAVPCTVSGVTIRPIDESAIKKLAQLAKGAITIPGIKITTTQEAVSR